MKQIRAVSHRHVMSRLLKDRRFQRGYENELEKLRVADRGSGNVFVDLGVAHPKCVMARAQVMSRIVEIIRKRGLTQKEAAGLLDISQLKVSRLMNGKLSMFSLEQLLELLKALG